MHWLKALVIPFCGAVVACLYMGQALACSPAGSFLSARSVYPPSGTVGVPVNAQLVVSYLWNALPSPNNPARNLGLRAAGGNPEDVVIISSEPQKIDWARRASHIVKPRLELKPNTTYELFDDNKRVSCQPSGTPPCEEGSQVVFATFTTGSSSDRKPPSFEGLQSAEGVPSEDGVEATRENCSNSACCGPYRYIKVKLDWNEATDDVSDRVRYNVYLGGALLHAFIEGGDLTGAQVCSGSGPLPLVMPPGRYTVKAVDWAGNEDTTIKPRDLESLCDAPIAIPDVGAQPDASAPNLDAALAKDAPSRDAPKKESNVNGGEEGWSCRFSRGSSSSHGAWLGLALLALVIAARKS